MRSTGSVEAAVAMVLERFARLDILVNNAGNFVGGVLANADIGGWQSVLDTHLASRRGALQPGSRASHD